MRRMSLVSLGVTLQLVAGTGFGQDPVLRPAREMAPPETARPWDVELVDLDGDGDLDLYTDGTRNEVHAGAIPTVYLYDDASGFRELAGAVDPAAGGEVRSDLAFADLDGDGDADGFRVSWWDTADQVLLGDGTGRLVLAPGAATSNAWGTAVALVDLDLDGDVDAVSDDSTALVGSALQVHVNGGGGTFATSAVPVWLGFAGQGADIAVGDVDADGYPDVVLTTGSYPQLVRNGPGLALVHDPAAIPLDATTHEVELGDMDGDGDLDLVSGTRDFSAPEAETDRVYANDGLGTFALAAVLPGGARVTTALDLADMDGDGDLDVVLAYGGGDFPVERGQELLRNDGGLVFVSVPAAFQSLSLDCGALALGDVDQDGDVDVVLGQQDLQTRLLLADGALGFAEATSALPWSGANGAILLADLDGDGDLDGWASLAAGQVQRNPGNGVLVPDPAATAGAVPPVPGGGPFAVAFDANGDGALDVYQARGSLLEDKLYVNGGAGSFTLGGINNLSSQTAAAGDVDGDGDADLVLDGRDFLRGDGAGGFSLVPFAIPGWDAKAAALADLDLDGDLDLVRGFGLGFTGGAPVWNAYVGPGFGPDVPLAGEVVVHDVATFDMDADGDPDVLFGTADGPLLLRNDGPGGFADVSATLPALTLPYGTMRVATVDLDLDGDTDIVAAKGPQYLVYWNQSGGVFTDGTAFVQGELAAPSGFAAGDVDGDGDVDLVATEHSGRLRVVTNHLRQLAWRGLPRAGKDLALDVSGRANAPWVLAISPGQAFLPLAPFGVLQLDPVGIEVVGSGVLDAAGQAAVVGLMPSGPGFVGLTVYSQAIVGLAPELTNLEIVTLAAY